MSDNICPKCKSEINAGDKFCKRCGFSFDNHKTNLSNIKSNFINFTDDIASKIQNKLENEDMLRTSDIKEMINSLDEDSFNRLLDKYGISPSKFKMLDFNKLLEKVDINKLKEDLIEFGIINSKSDSDVKTTVIIDDEENEEPMGEENGEELRNNETTEPPREKSPNINICGKCGFENRSKVKFCTNCGNKLI